MKIIKIFGVWAGLLLFNACSGRKDDPNFIRVGITYGPEQEVAEVAKKVAQERYGLEVELIPFNDYVIPNQALTNRDIDINAFQHIPYLTEQSKQRGYNLVPVGNTFVYPIVAYSKKIKNIRELQDGSTIVIPNDPTNGSRSLLLLQKNEVLKLRSGVGLLPKVTDIIENPKHLKIMEIEGAQIPRILDDRDVIVGIINNNFATQIGLNQKKEGILVEDKDSPYVNVIVARQDNKNSPKVKNFVKAYQSPEVEKKAQEIFKGGAVKGWN